MHVAKIPFLEVGVPMRPKANGGGPVNSQSQGEAIAQGDGEVDVEESHVLGHVHVLAASQHVKDSEGVQSGHLVAQIFHILESAIGDFVSEHLEKMSYSST